MYVFGALLITGAILHLNHLWWLLVVPVLFVVQVLRARKEAIVLEAAFGDEYRGRGARAAPAHPLAGDGGGRLSATRSRWAAASNLESSAKHCSGSVAIAPAAALTVTGRGSNRSHSMRWRHRRAPERAAQELARDVAQELQELAARRRSQELALELHGATSSAASAAALAPGTTWRAAAKAPTVTGTTQLHHGSRGGL